MFESLTKIQRAAPEAVLASLRNDNQSTSKEAAAKLLAEAKSYGIGLRQFLQLRIDPRLAEKPEVYQDGTALLNGYEAALSYLRLPTRDDFEGGVTLQLAADTFQTFPGVRALFPEVIDDMVRWRYRQTNFETIDGFISQSRQVSQTEVLSTVIEDTQADYEETVLAVSESGRIPIHAIKASQQTVKFWKFGLGYKTSYEFNRRVALDYLTPYAVRTQSQIQRSKVAAATHILLNGDNGGYGAAPVVDQSGFDGGVIGTATDGILNWKHLTAWLAARAEAGTPVDTVAGNWNAYLQWLFLFAVNGTNGTITDAEQLAGLGVQVAPSTQRLDMNVKFVLSTSMPANQLLGFSKGDTLEELVEAGSLISELEQSIQTQEVTYTRTENSGYRLVFGDTRSVFDYSA